MLSPFKSFLIKAGTLAAISFATSKIAIAADLPHISDGSPVEVSKFGIKVTPPKDWEVITNHPTLTLVMQEQADKKVVYDKPIFQRNITLSLTHQPSPIDEQRAKELEAEITANFGNSALSTDLKILEHKFFQFNDKEKGILVYSTFKSGEFDMMQAHVLLSDSQRQYILNYIDLADRFSKDETFNKAWQSMVSIEISSPAPKRYQDLIVYGGSAGFLVLLMIAFFVYRNRRFTKSFMADADRIYEDGDEGFVSTDDGAPLTQTSVWHLDRTPNQETSFVTQMSRHTRPAVKQNKNSKPASHVSTLVSNFF